MIFPSYSPCVGFFFPLALHSFHERREKEALHFTPYSGKLGSNFLVVVTRYYCDAKPIGKLTKMDVSITLPTPAGRHHLPIYVAPKKERFPNTVSRSSSQKKQDE